MTEDGRSTSGEKLQEFPGTPPLAGGQVDLEPLRVEHAEEMAPLLDDPGLHTFIGGRPATLPDLRERYRRQVAGHSRDGSQRWLNWVVRRREDGQAVGTVQATVTQQFGEQKERLIGEVAWVIAAPYQGHGYARDAAGAVVAWLREQRVATVVAHVHPDHRASEAVARSVGLSPTSMMVDGEVRWES